MIIFWSMLIEILNLYYHELHETRLEETTPKRKKISV